MLTFAGAIAEIRSNKAVNIGTKVSIPEVHRVTALSEGGCLVYTENSEVAKIDHTGNTQLSFHTDSFVTGIIEAHGTVYILQENGEITKILSDLETDFRSYKVEVGELWPGDVAGEDLLVLVDSARGELFTYDLKSRQKDYKVGLVGRPVGVSCINTNNGPLYAVCEWKDNCISLFNSKWRLCKKFGGKGREDGKLNRPNCVIFTPWETLLVADTGNNRISEFSTDGTFLQHVLVKDDITGPVSISCSHPYLWVADEKANLFCFTPFGL